MAHIVWEDEEHLAFLSIYPNTEGVTVVIPKKHYSSYVFDLPDQVLSELTVAAKKVAKILDEKLEDVGRTALVFEGYGVDHAHAKLFPMHGTSEMKDWVKIESTIDKFYPKYEGYISSHDSKEEDSNRLKSLADKLKSK